MMSMKTGNVKILLAFILPAIFQQFSLYGQKISTEDYIKTYKDIAIQKMREYRIPASITLAQGILESGSGNSVLARRANNHFGIKCHSWRGKKFYQDDDHKNECFRRYRSAEESFRDHSLFLTQRSRYATLFDLEITDYKGWSYGLKRAGYATNPKYPQLLIRIIEEYQLYAYDRGNDPIFLTKKSSKRATSAETNNTVEPPDYMSSEYPVQPSSVIIQTGPSGRYIYSNNGIKFIYARGGDDFATIAGDFNLYSWQIYKYNDLDKKSRLYKNQVIYLEKKKRKGDKKTHRIKSGESMHTISQLYGIRLKRLYKMNNMEEGSRPKAGQILKLR